MAKLVDTLLLLALPASGKSEARRYMAHLSPEQCQNEFRIGPTVQLDDFPYVHFMRRIDEELGKLQQPSIFYHGFERPFKEPYDWGTLIHLLNDDYADLRSGTRRDPPAAAEHMFQRIDRGRVASGLPASLGALSQQVRQGLAGAMEAEAAKLLSDLRDVHPDSLGDKTIVLEFARGGPDGASMPLEPPNGYKYALSQLSPEILGRSAVLYIWVTPEESRRKNEVRADPDDPGSILHHGCPLEVMMNDYGCDDIDYLVQQSTRSGTICIEAHGREYFLPIARFDNRVDKTTFVRDEAETWSKEDMDALHAGLKEAFVDLIKAL